MTLGDVFSGGLTSLENNEIKEVKNTIKGKNASIGNIRNKNLEEVLNNLIYPKETNKQSQYADLINSIADSYVDIILDRLSTVNLNAVVSAASQMAANTEQNIKSTDRISFRLNGLIKEINADLEILLNNPTSAADAKVNKIKNDIQKINYAVGEISINYDKARKFLTYKDDDFKTLKSYLTILESYAELLRVLPSSQQLGDAFENTLKKAINVAANSATNNLIKESGIKFATLTGKEQVARTANTGGVNLTVSIEYQDETEENGERTNIEVKGKGYSISYTPTDEESSKMDIDIYFSSKNPKKLSLKNWANIHYSNNKWGIGETNILSALIRSAGLNSSQNYSLTLLSNSSSILNSAHNFAKLSIAADILMGISQKDNWASDLVINDRSKKCIYVYNIPSLLNDIEKNLNITGYNGSYLGSISHNILKNVKVRENRTNKYIQNMFGLLKSKMVSVKLSGALPKKN